MTEEEAYSAMFIFIDAMWERNKNEGLAIILGDMSIMEDGFPADPAILEDWRKAVQRVRNGEPIRKMGGNGGVN